MNIDDIKEYIVILNGGSGCVIQPETHGYTYVLTAKHVFDDINEPPYNGHFTITRFQRNEGGWKEVPKIVSTLTEENYFPHPTKDIAILKISKIPGLEKLVRTDNITGEKDRRGYTLAGYPQARRTGTSSNWYRNNEDTVIKEMRENGLREAQVQGNPDVDEVRGQSGGGIVKIAGDFILLAGIQNKMVDGEEQLGNIEFSPLLNFDEIIAAHREKLRPITPKAGHRKKLKLPKPVDEIYVCDREVFKANFDHMYEQNKSGVQNYIIVGPAPHSPLGVSRKIIYERFTGTSLHDKYNYPCDPNIAINNPLKFKGALNFINLIEGLYNVQFDNEKISAYERKRMNQGDIFGKLVTRLDIKPVNFFIIELFYESKEEQDKIIDLVKDFTDTLKQYAVNLSSEVLFFWCFTYDLSLRDQTLDMSWKLLQKFSPQPLPKLYFFDRWIASRFRNKIRQFLDKNKGAYHITLVNDCESLTIPPRTFIEEWLEKIDREGIPEGYIVPAADRIQLLKEKTTTAIENGFLKILADYNKTITSI